MSADEVVVTGVGTTLAGAGGRGALLDADSVVGADPVVTVSGRGVRYLDRATRLALSAAGDCLAEAGVLLGPKATEGDGIAVVASSNFGNLDTVCEMSARIAAETSAALSALALPTASSNVLAAATARWYSLRGPNLLLCNGNTSGLDAIGWAVALLRARRCAGVLVVGAEPRNEVVARFTGVAAPELFEGAVAVYLESSDRARARGARAMARIGAYARADSPAAYVEKIGRDAARACDLWLTEDTDPDAGLDGLTRRALAPRYGWSSGAHGVLQCAAAVAWLESGGGAAVMTSGGDDDFAGLVVSGHLSVPDEGN
ncbi:beta-ketoacyl synthase N-terminal-like domain-containing protein [Nocardia takedensis]|uniref:beta-ketoacyl synthase N-terminal-like domain-containing protein n=1 Tax=Nocardia takedensis TaxID=259390 RepID=UPI0002E9AE24|nr:beta-ketoacyl synthase N-terminal-like domain-containing protein [Nocardia takedensis]